ncbi:MAG: efflux transporter outer membrane subunit [Gammaproteobacteria bacterium]|nr:efflux transporter outer membrane subunit [Gammaproteobacteria bacterium]
MMRARILLTLAAAALSACATAPEHRVPEIDPGAGWTLAPEDAQVDVDLSRWWASFGDETLERLIEQALTQNLDIRQADARVAEARAMRSAAAGGRYPVGDAGASVVRRRQSETGPLPIRRIPELERDQTIYEPRFDAAWEPDFFGRTRSAVAAAEARAENAVEQRRGVQLAIAAETARSYFSLRGAQHELDARRAAVEAARESVLLVRRRFEAGDAPEAALVQAEAELRGLEAQLPTLEAAVRTTALAIGLLLGERPEAELALIERHEDFVTLAPVPVGERADLLRRRPDVRAAERALAAATADLGIATAELFPRVTLGAGAGFQSLSTGTLLDSASQIATAALSISWRVLDGGRVRAEIEAGEARVEAAALEYERSVLQALSDAEQALARYQFGLAAVDLQAAAVDAARRNREFADLRFRAGDISLLELLDAERVLRNAEDAYARVHTLAATDLVALFKALGGGWREG